MYTVFLCVDEITDFVLLMLASTRGFTQYGKELIFYINKVIECVTRPIKAAKCHYPCCLYKRDNKGILV